MKRKGIIWPVRSRRLREHDRAVQEDKASPLGIESREDLGMKKLKRKLCLLAIGGVMVLLAILARR